MTKTAAIVIASAAAWACGGMVTDPSAQTVVTLVSLSPTAGPVGSQVQITGTAFAASANTVLFAAESVSEGEVPSEPGVVPDRPSADGRMITFTIPDQWRPACSYQPEAPCPFANIRTAPGIYRVSVTNANGTSGGLRLTVTR